MNFDIRFRDGGPLPPEITRDRVALFCRLQQLETWFRELVYVEMKARYGSSWWAECDAALKRSKGPGIPAHKSLKRDARHPHMATPETDPLWFVSFDALLKILFDRKLWKLFAPYLTTKQLLRAKFEELMPVRHRIAHIRALHPDDLKRTEQVMRDLDQGFWRFCASYNNEQPFIAKRQKDPIFQYLSDRMHGGYVEVEKNKWGYVADRRNASMDIMMGLIVRASAGKGGVRSSATGRKGVLYDVIFSVAHTSKSFQSGRILAATRREHDRLVHIVLDSSQSALRITLPAVLGESELKHVIDRFDDACRNSITPVRAGAIGQVGIEFNDDLDSYATKIRPLKLLAAQWPHYVLTPDNPIAILNPDTPCGFFGI
jgi:Swt1-like HEPN